MQELHQELPSAFLSAAEIVKIIIQKLKIIYKN